MSNKVVLIKRTRVAKNFATTKTINSNLAAEIKKYNEGKVDPEQLFVKNSGARKMLLEGKLSFPLSWAQESSYYPGKINTEGLSSSKFFRRLLKIDEEFACEVYDNSLIDFTTDTLYDCIDVATETSLDMADSLLDECPELPLGEWKRSMSQCLSVIMLREFTPKAKQIATKLIERGGDINYPHVTTHVLQLLLQRYHKFPKNFTAEKLEFMFQHGLDMNYTFSSTSGITFMPAQINLEYLFTNGIPIDEYIEMLQIIKKYKK